MENSKEKQIEEMAKDLIESHSIDAWAARVHGEAYTDYNATARKLIANGWQKQSEGEWTVIRAQGFAYAKCTRCEKDYPMPPHWTIGDVVKYRRFCPNCGAKMKGGAE